MRLVVALEKATWVTMRCTTSCRTGNWPRWHWAVTWHAVPGDELGLGGWAAAARRPLVTAREGCCENIKDKDRERRALVSRVGLSCSFEFC